MTFGKMGTDREERINYERMRAYRLARTREQMKKHGIGTLVTWEPWNIRYIAGVYVTVPTRWIENQFVVLPRNGDPHVYAASSFSPYAMREAMPWLKDKIWATRGNVKTVNTIDELEGITKSIARIISEHGLTNEPVGIDGTDSELLVTAALAQNDLTALDFKLPMFEARKLKNKDEIECIRHACASAEAAFADIAQAIRPGVTECELLGIGMKRLYTLGADETQEFVVASGPRTNPLWIDFTDRQIRPGDLVIVDINGNSFHGYKSCYYRTFCCGKATQKQKDTYEECRAMMYAGMDGVKAGNTTYDITKHWPDSPKYWGYERWGEVQGYAVGHGIGLSLHEFPLIAPVLAKRSPEMLEEGMVIALETWTGKRGGDHGVRLEENMLITKDGYELLTLYPVDQITECWT